MKRKKLAYKKIVSHESRLERVVKVLEALSDCYTYSNIDPYEAMQKNIDKLKARFPEKFTEELANNRDLVKEREILEG